MKFLTPMTVNFGDTVICGETKRTAVRTVTVTDSEQLFTNDFIEPETFLEKYPPQYRDDDWWLWLWAIIFILFLI